MAQHKHTPHGEFRQRENLRINASPNLADKFGELKGLAVDLAYFDPAGLRKSSEIKYTVNLTHAKSVFSFMCPNNRCVGGDFDLSDKLARAVAARVATATGEMSCQGLLELAVNSPPCCNILRYTLKLKY